MFPEMLLAQFQHVESSLVLCFLYETLSHPWDPGLGPGPWAGLKGALGGQGLEEQI